MPQIRILTIRQPYASALLTGAYDAERRKFRLSGPTLIHAAKEPAMPPKKASEWLSSRDPHATHAMEWAQAVRADMPPESPLSDVIIDSVAAFDTLFPFGKIIGYVEDWEPVREGLEWANKPVNPVHFQVEDILPEYRGALGHLPCPQSVVDLVKDWIPQS